MNNFSCKITNYFQWMLHLGGIFHPQRMSLFSHFMSGALWLSAPHLVSLCESSKPFPWGPLCPAGLSPALCGKRCHSPPPLLSDPCTCHGWQAERASHSECWNGLWKAAPKPEREKNGLFLYHQGSSSSCVILGEVDSIVKGCDDSGLPLPCYGTLFFRCLCHEAFRNTILIHSVWKATCWILSVVLSCLVFLPLIFSITLTWSIIILP